MVFDRLKGFRRQLRGLLRKSVVESEMEEEFAFHLRMLIEQKVAQGMDPAAARRAALLEFGGVERFGERVREVRRLRWIEELAYDARYAMRSIARRPAFASTVIAILAIGIGGTTAVFSIVNALFLQAPPGVSRPSEVVRLFVVREAGAIQTPEGWAGWYGDYEALRNSLPGAAGVAAFLAAEPVDLGRGSESERIRVRATGSGFLPLLGVSAVRGRLFGEEDAVGSGDPAVAVISHRLWKRLGADPAAVGRTMELNGTPVTVIGVAQPDFSGIDPEPDDVWVPLPMAAPLGLVRFGGSGSWQDQPIPVVHLVGRLADGTTPGAMAADATAVLRHAAEGAPHLDPAPEVVWSSLLPGRALHGSEAASIALWVLLVAGFVLAIASANVLGLMLARATTRRHELAVRLALGAGRGRIVRQHLAETLLLGFLGGVAGVLVAALGVGIARQFPVGVDFDPFATRVLVFALGLSLLLGLIVGLLPAVRSSSAGPHEALREGRAGVPQSRGRLRRTLVTAQVALAVVLLVGAGLFVRSLQELHGIDPHVTVDRLLLVTADLRRAGLTAEEQRAFYALAEQRLDELPIVERSAMAHFGPFSRGGLSLTATVVDPELDLPSVPTNVEWVGPGYFEAVGTRIVAGRGITPEDMGGAEPVAVVNDALGRTLAPGGSPVGLCITVLRRADGRCVRVIGVSQTQRLRLMSAEEQPLVFLQFDGKPPLAWGGPVLLVRTSSGDGGAPATIRAALHTIRPDLPYISVQAAEERITSETLPYRLGATLFSLFGGLALVLTAAGLYGVLSYYVAERSREIAVRRSLGADSTSLLRLLLHQALLPVGTGLLLGLLAAGAGSRVLASLTFGVSEHDPLAFLGAAGFLLLVSGLATALPTRRAIRLDPMRILRAE